MIWRYHIHKVVLRLPDSWWNWNLEMLVFEERGKAEYPQKNLSEQTQLTLWHRRRDLNPGHIGGRRALSPLRHPLLRVQTDANLLANKFLSEQLPTFLLFCDRRSVAQQCWIRLQTSSNINCAGATHADYTWSSKSYGLYPSHNALQVLTLLGVVTSVCTPLATRRLKTPNIVGCVRLYIVLADNTDRVRDKFCMVKVVFVLVLYSPLDASGP